MKLHETPWSCAAGSNADEFSGAKALGSNEARSGIQEPAWRREGGKRGVAAAAVGRAGPRPRTWTVIECVGRTRGEAPGGTAAQSTSTSMLCVAEEHPSEARSVRL